MFVPHARVHISGIPHSRQNKARHAKLARRRVGIREILRMPCLVPTVIVVFIGLIVLAGGAGMCVLGYIPDPIPELSEITNSTTLSMAAKDASYYTTRSLSYAGPILMGCGFFAIIVSCVLYCEIVDRYAVLMPRKPETRLKRRDLLEMILGEFKKSYFRGIEVPIRKDESSAQKGGERQMETLLKALSISTPVLLMSPDLAPTWRFSHYPYSYRTNRHLALKPRHPKLKQLGGSGSSGHEPWLKTSSLPNICDPELRRHNLPRPVPLDQQESGRARRIKRFGRPSRSMDNRISWSLPQTLSRSCSGVDNPAYLHEQDRKKSVSMCVHASSYSSAMRKSPASRFIKASQLQPRVRLQHQQQQQIQKHQQQQQQQQLQLQQKQQHQGQPQQSKRLIKQHSSRESDEGYGRRRCDSDASRPRQRPKLVRTKGAHKSFDSSGESAFSTLLPSEPPPFPLPAHFMHAKTQDNLHAVSPKTAKLLRAKCKSEDVRDKKKPDIMLLKDLFRSVDVHEPPPHPPSLITQTSSTSMPCTAYPGLYLDPLAGKQCENVKIILHPQVHENSKTLSGKSESAFVRVAVSPSGSNSECKNRNAVLRASPLSTGDSHTSSLEVDSSDQRYELPLLSGVARSIRQWEAERRKKISGDSRHEEKSHSLDAKDSKSSKLDVKRAEIHRAHSFNAPLAHEAKPNPTKLQTLTKRSHDREKEKESSKLLQIIKPHAHKYRAKSWDGDKVQSLDTPNFCDGSKTSKLGVPRIERASSFDPMASQTSSSCEAKKSKQATSYSSEFVRPGSPCQMIYEGKAQTDRSHSDEIRQRTPTPQCLTLPVPLKPQIAQASRERSTGAVSPLAQQHCIISVPEPQNQSCSRTQSPRLPSPAQSSRHPSPVQFPAQLSWHPSPSQSAKHFSPNSEKLPSPSQPARHLSPNSEKLPSPTLSASNLSPVQSPRLSSPVQSPRHQSPSQSDVSAKVVQAQEQSSKGFKLKAPSPHEPKQENHQHCGRHSMRQSQTEQHLSERQQKCQQQHQRRPTIVHQASVHLSLDSFPDSSASVTSSTLSSTDNTTSSNAPLLPSSGARGSGRGTEGDSSSTHAVRRAKYIQSRSLAVEASSPEDEDTEATPLLQTPSNNIVSGPTFKS